MTYSFILFYMRMNDVINILKKLDEFKNLKFVTNGKLYNYRSKIEESFSLIAYNSYNEPVIIAGGVRTVPAIIDSYSSVKYYFALGFIKKNVYDIRLGKWTSIEKLDIKRAIKANKFDAFWLTLILIAIFTIILLFVLFLLK